jgi:serine/threonine protein kinase
MSETVYTVGQRFGPYTLVKELGKGSFGVVWLADDEKPNLYKRQVAVKLPRSSATAIEDFLIDVKMWARASGHTNVLTFLDADIFSGQVLIASEYASQGTLSQWLKDHGGRAPSVEAAVAMATGILEGLSYIHSLQIVHRDLKPGNILLKDGQPRIADFGLARDLGADPSTLRPTGTPLYMAPEAWHGVRCSQSDVWAVGIMLYEMLSGSRPFMGSDSHVLQRAVEQTPHPPLPAHVPAHLRAIVDRALQKNQADRYESADTMLKALRGESKGRSETTEDPAQTIAQPVEHPQQRLQSRRQKVLSEVEQLLRDSERLDSKVLELYTTMLDVKTDSLTKNRIKQLAQFLTEADAGLDLIPQLTRVHAELAQKGLHDLAEITARIADHVLTLHFPPAIINRVCDLHRSRGVVCFERVAATPAGVEIAMAGADGRPAEFIHGGSGPRGRPGLQFEEVPLGESSKQEESVRDALLHFTRQLAPSLATPVVGQDLSKQIQICLRILTGTLRAKKKVTGRTIYCVLPKLADETMRQERLQMLSRIRAQLPDLVFVELWEDADTLEVEATIIWCLEERHTNQASPKK